MSISDQIANLKALSAVDARIAALEAELQKHRAGMGEKAESRQGLSVKIERLLEGVQAMESTRNELIGEMRQTSTLLERSREKLMRCRNEREANAVSREIEELRRLLRERDIETQKLIGLIDEARADLDRSAAERDEIGAQIDATEGEVVTQIRALEADLAKEKAQRAELTAAGDRNLIRKYDAVRARRGTGISVTTQGRCVTCNISLPPMLQQRIMQGSELFQCPSCQRILYFETPEPSGAAPDGPAVEGPAAEEPGDASASAG